jgi:hypothetical protein
VLNYVPEQVGRHAFAGLAGPATVRSSWARVLTGELRVTASGAVRVGVEASGSHSAANCARINGTEVLVRWNGTSESLTEFVGGTIGLVFDVPAGSVLYAFHV